jgi:hypothetical protein
MEFSPTRNAIAIAACAITACVIASIAVAFSGCASEAIAPPSTGRMQVTFFRPLVPNAPQREGHCWTRSIAADREGAWRCMIGSAIEDPCFSIAEFSDAVICGASPVNSRRGYLVRLTKHLPSTSGVGLPPPSPWIVELAIGQGQIPGPFAMPSPRVYCVAMTGTVPVIDGQPVRYSCWEDKVDSKAKLGDTQIGLLGDFNHGRIWTVTEVSYKVGLDPVPNQPPYKQIEKSTVALEQVWE